MKAPILKGEKVILKPLEISQAENFISWLKDEEVAKFLSANNRDLTLKKEKEFINKSNEDETAIRWAIYTKNRTHIGGTGLQQIDKKNLKAICGIFIGDKNYWGQGYGVEVLKTILKYAFIKLQLNRVELAVFLFNKRAIKCYKKCGFIIEGRKKQAIKKNGKFIDDIIMGITKSDYKKFIKK